MGIFIALGRPVVPLAGDQYKSAKEKTKHAGGTGTTPITSYWKKCSCRVQSDIPCIRQC